MAFQQLEPAEGVDGESPPPPPQAVSTKVSASAANPLPENCQSPAPREPTHDQGAMALSNLGVDLKEAGRSLDEIRQSYLKARDLGVQAGTPEGQRVAEAAELLIADIETEL